LTELIKTILGLQRTHTLPALWLAFVESLPKRDYKRHIKIGEKLKQELKIILGDDGVLLFPSFPVSAMYHNQPLVTNSFDWIYYGMHLTESILFFSKFLILLIFSIKSTGIFNVFGFPVTQCPLGLNSEGLPTGVQLVSNHNCDHLTIKVAEHLESNLIGWIAPS